VPLSLADVSDAPALPPADRIPRLPVEWLVDIEPQLTGLWLVKRLLPAQGLALIYGHPGSGKSFFALDLAMHVALGWDWARRRVKPGLVIYIGAEGVAGLRNRLVAFRRHYEIEDRIPFALIPTPIDMQDPNADTKRLAETIRAAARDCGDEPAMVVIDTLSKTFGAGKENTDDMATYVANCQRIASEFQCLVVPVHHRPKDAESTEPRGHGSLKGGVDTVILIEAGKVKSAEVTKQKDGEIGERIHFTLHPVELGNDEDGDAVTSCIVQLSDAAPAAPYDPYRAAISKLSAGNRLIMEQLGELLETAGVAPPSEIPDAEIDRRWVTRVAPFTAWRDKCLSGSGTTAGQERDTLKRAFNRGVKQLQLSKIVRVWNDWAWLTHRLPTSGGTEPGQPSGHDRDTGTAGTGVFRPCPNVPPRQSAEFDPDDPNAPDTNPGWDDDRFGGRG